MMRPPARPGIFQTGQVDVESDGTLFVHRWGVTVCAAGCTCHRHPANGHLYVLEDQQAGLLGLRCYADTPCGCCTPWTVDELIGVLHDLAAVDALSTEAIDPRG